MTVPQLADLEDIQGLVYSGWSDHRYAGYLFATLGDEIRASRAWLANLAPRITPAAQHLRRCDGRLQLGVSASGLTALGVPADVVAMLAPEARAGMASRYATLGDAHPSTWQLGGSTRLDVLVMVYACDRAARASELTRLRDELVLAGAEVTSEELSEPLAHNREHFGFADGLSQPFVPGMHAGPREGQDRVPAGDILLGYPNAYGQLPLAPIWGGFDLGKNGSYLVFRKLKQDVAGFWGWIARHAARLAGHDATEAARLTELIGAKVVGRWRSGAPLSLTPDRDNKEYATRNDFKYLVEDPHGLGCPVSSHIRRANPRDARGGTARESETVVGRHRILRRGRSYGTPLPDAAARAGQDDGVPRGLYFVSLQSSIARGFEFIQQSWLGNSGFNGLYRDSTPISGDIRGQNHFTIPAKPVRLRLDDVPAVVTTLGGEYFLLLSRSAIAHLGRPGYEPASREGAR